MPSASRNVAPAGVVITHTSQPSPWAKRARSGSCLAGPAPHAIRYSTGLVSAVAIEAAFPHRSGPACAQILRKHEMYSIVGIGDERGLLGGEGDGAVAGRLRACSALRTSRAGSLFVAASLGRRFPARTLPRHRCRYARYSAERDGDAPAARAGRRGRDPDGQAPRVVSAAGPDPDARRCRCRGGGGEALPPIRRPGALLVLAGGAGGPALSSCGKCGS